MKIELSPVEIAKILMSKVSTLFVDQDAAGTFDVKWVTDASGFLGATVELVELKAQEGKS